MVLRMSQGDELILLPNMLWLIPRTHDDNGGPMNYTAEHVCELPFTSPIACGDSTPETLGKHAVFVLYMATRTLTISRSSSRRRSCVDASSS